MKFLVATLALSQAVVGQFDTPTQPAGVISASRSCLLAATEILSAVPISSSCRGSVLFPTSGTSQIENSKYYDKYCSSACKSAFDEGYKNVTANCTSKDDQNFLKAWWIGTETKLSRECLKFNGDYCGVLHYAALNATNDIRWSISSNYYSDTSYTVLCSPCLKKQVEIVNAGAIKAAPYAGTSADQLSVDKKSNNRLVEMCPAQSILIPQNANFTGPFYVSLSVDSAGARISIAFPGLALIMALLFI